jgi:hypothetical protein
VNRKLLLVYLIGLGVGQPAVAQQIAAPSDTTALSISESRVDVSWRDNSSKEDGFELFRSASGANGLFSLVGKTGAGATTLGDLGLNPSTQYCYKVRAVGRVGNRTRHSEFSSPACATTAAPPVQPGTIHIVTATTGFDLDINGYSARLGGGPGMPIGTNAYLTIPNVGAGQYSVSLDQLASNCFVEGDNPRAVTVSGGAITEVLFTVTCGAGPAIEIAGLTTGNNLDPDGYNITLWQQTPGARTFVASAGLPANGNVRFFGLDPSQYELEVGGVAANCVPSPLPPVDLVSGGIASLVLSVSCALPPGVICSVEICDNGNDDDCDGLVDGVDPDCSGCIDCSFNHCPPGYICGYDGCCVPHCGDGQWNGTEGDVDCGGDCAAKCQTGQHCWTSPDCASFMCHYDRCL